MKLISITIENFRCIENEIFAIKEIDGGYTYTLIGINETGKSSFLKAISLIDSEELINYPQDFYDKTKPVNIKLLYQVEQGDITDLHKAILEKGFVKELLSQISIENNNIEVILSFEPIPNSPRQLTEEFEFKTKIFNDYTLSGNTPVKKDPTQTQDDFDLDDYWKKTFPNFFWEQAHVITFWKSSNEYLINERIDLNSFAANPKSISVPLKNCFELAKIEDIQTEIEKIRNNPAELRNLQEKLSDKVTAHIKSVWPNHPVKIKFQVDNMQLSFLVEDEGVKYESKTTSQRSDGFRQFISFLLTVSAESVTKEFSNTLLLLDEPETHLHPQAQEYLRDELIKITKNKENNIIFFATHSVFMIDREHLGRCFKLIKIRNKKTKIEQIEEKKTSFAEIIYEVFGIPTADYHNELYGHLEEKNKSDLDSLPKNKKWRNKKTGDEETVSLSKYIRHAIHHPENTLNKSFTKDELEESIKVLRQLKYDKS